MGSNLLETKIDPETPAPLAKVHPRVVGSRCWNRLYLERKTPGQFRRLASYMFAVVITGLGVVISLLIYTIGYALMRPDVTMGGK